MLIKTIRVERLSEDLTVNYEIDKKFNDFLKTTKTTLVRANGLYADAGMVDIKGCMFIALPSGWFDDSIKLIYSDFRVFGEVSEIFSVKKVKGYDCYICGYINKDFIT